MQRGQTSRGSHGARTGSAGMTLQCGHLHEAWFPDTCDSAASCVECVFCSELDTWPPCGPDVAGAQQASAPAAAAQPLVSGEEIAILRCPLRQCSARALALQS